MPLQVNPPLFRERPLFLCIIACTDSEIVPKPDHIFDLERRQQVLETEIAQALQHCSADDPMVGDLKSRLLHLKEEIERFCNMAIADRRLH